tara:strand:+ start:7330 stop:7608 length:279 start_codon:yes stop_codon:yes gene_type:complete
MFPLAFILFGSFIFGVTLGTTIICANNYPIQTYPKKIYFVEYYSQDKLIPDDTIIMSNNTYDDIILNNQEKKQFNKYKKYETENNETSKDQI